MAAGLWLPPARDRLGLFTRTLVNGYFNNERVALLLRELLAEVGGRLGVLWDGGSMHKGDPIRELVG